MFLESIKREVTLVTQTVKISRQIKAKLLEWVVVVDGEATRIPALNADNSEEIKVQLLFQLSQDELDNLSDEDYDILKKEIAKKK